MRGRALPGRLAVAAVLVGALALAGPASATPATLRRAVSNLLFAPLDLLLSPATGAWGVYTGLREQDDPQAVRVAFALPGVIWNAGVHAGASCLRGLAGLLELPVGVGLLWSEADLDPLYSPAERSEAWVDHPTPLLHVKFGIDYTAPASF